MARRKAAPKKKQPKNNVPTEIKLRKNIRMESLDPAKAPKVRKELLDYDPEFLRKLKKTDPKAYEYLAAFTEEYVGAGIAKNKNGSVKRGYLHNTKALAKDRYDANNHRNNDVLGVTKANHILKNVDDELRSNDGWYVNRSELAEMSMITELDRTDNEENILSYEEFQKIKKNMTPEMVLFYEAFYFSEED